MASSPWELVEDNLVTLDLLTPLLQRIQVSASSLLENTYVVQKPRQKIKHSQRAVPVATSEHHLTDLCVDRAWRQVPTTCFRIFGSSFNLKGQVPHTSIRTVTHGSECRAHTLNSEIHALPKCCSFPTTVLEDLLQNELTPFFYTFISLVLLLRAKTLPLQIVAGSCLRRS